MAAGIVSYQWIPVSSPSVTKPYSPAAAGSKKTTEEDASSAQCIDEISDKAPAADSSMVHATYDHKRVAPHSLKMHGVDKLNIGFAPVDLRGNLLLDLKNTGGWRAAFFIFGNETAERMAFFGILVNLLFYLYLEMHITFPEASTLVTNVVGTSSLTPLLGAFIADAYIGRYWTIGIFSTVYFLGLILLTVSSISSSLRPTSVGCDELHLFLGSCQLPSRSQMAFLYVALYTIALGSGGIRPCVSSFGADQFDVENSKEREQLPRFFNGFYFMITFGIFLSLTVVVYISEYISWAWGFGTLSIAMAAANIIFFLGTPFYRHRIPSGSPLTRFVQVMIAALRKRRVKTPKNKDDLYEVYDKESAIPGSRKLKHTYILSFLDKAAVETANDKAAGQPVTTWRLCTVTQVEEVKILVKVIPIWATTIILNTVFLQILNFGAQQALSMDRRLFSFTVPAASVPVAAATIILIFLPFYDRVMVPFMRKFTGNPRGISFLQRIGVGLFISILAAIVAALLEKKRRQVSWETNTARSYNATVPLSAWWLTIPFCMTGLAEIFASIGQLEFFYDQAPDGMRSIGTAFFSATSALGAYLGSFLITITTKYAEHHAQQPWINALISLGHMDYYFWLLAVLSGINFVVYLFCAHMYEYKIDSQSTMREALVQALANDTDESHKKGREEGPINCPVDGNGVIT
uniref:Uncharacterized protein n=1 Tax=Physcomitrium patens TaxID=3218 RepID=A0A2K1INH0_PHYPA|nr:protein NRT1/ PTR FAMILY 8.2-like isoform X2 [Physcomitrium patens]PNR30826.1 hypothetical protein PHYPA_027142 [Physcomitrium patens]|eukprot:XP_024361455.1 protein NRT1/ PTR FAMILY 8.2-like isoform X2 [Physcomitrella patens]